MSAESQVATAKTERTAILVIHGIGQQDPYETLDSFAGGLARYLREERKAQFAIRPERIAHKDWTEVAIHLDFTSPVERSGLKLLSLYEYYWAPYTQDKVTWRGSLQFLLKADLTPLRYLAANLQMMLGASPEKRKKWWQVIGIFLREVIRAAMLFAPLAILLGMAYAWLPEPSKMLEALRDYGSTLQEVPRWPLAEFAVSLVVALAMALFLWQTRKRAGWISGRNMQRQAEWTWTALALATLIGSGWLACCIANTTPQIGQLVEKLAKDYMAFKAAALTLLVVLLRKILVEYVGDIAVYVSADKKTKGFEARSKILDGSTEALKRLLADKTRNYDQVIVAGHSLGSVIAYDTINELLSQVWATDDQTNQGPQPKTSTAELAKLKGLVTFGCPLDKIYYLFREQVSEQQAFRAQILSFLHSYRKERAGRDYGDAVFQYDTKKPPVNPSMAFPELPGLVWLNVYAPTDPVSGYLNFYRLEPEKQLRRLYLLPLAAHLKYWRDPEFYKFFGKRML